MQRGSPMAVRRHSPEVARHLFFVEHWGRKGSRGHMHKDPPHSTKQLLSALRDSPATCSNPIVFNGWSFSLCASENAVIWSDTAGEQQRAHPSPALDSLLSSTSSSGSGPVWARVSHTMVRQVATAHYVSQNKSACDGAAAYVLRLRFFCGGVASDGDVSLVRLRRSSHTPHLVAPWRATKAEGGPRCEIEGLVDVPRLCTAPFDDPALPRLDELFERAYAGRHGHRPLHEGQPELTYGELNPVGMLSVIDALARARDEVNGAADDGASRSRLRDDDVFVDVRANSPDPSRPFLWSLSLVWPQPAASELDTGCRERR
jgi:hypothetical protein